MLNGSYIFEDLKCDRRSRQHGFGRTDIASFVEKEGTIEGASADVYAIGELALGSCAQMMELAAKLD